MTYLLDTHVLLWLVEAPERLPRKVAGILRASSASMLGLSAITPWEIAKKVSLGKLKLACPLGEWLARSTRPEGITLLPLTVEIAIHSTQLPGSFHKDPADQIIAATARVNRLVLITADEKLLRYPHLRTLWE